MKMNSKPNARQRLLCEGYDDVAFFSNYSYDDALIGVTDDNRAVYDFDKMVEWLSKDEGWSIYECIEWIECNTIAQLPFWGDKCPVIMYPLRNLKEVNSEQ